MMHIEKQTFIDEELKQLWPQWEWTPATLRVWFGILNDFNFTEAQQAISKIYTNGLINYQKQLVPVFLKTAKRENKPKEGKDPFVLFYVVYPEGHKIGVYDDREGWTLEGAMRTGQEYIDRFNLTDCVVQVGEIFGDEKRLREPDGLRGNAAAKQAKDNILAGPDCPGKQWLLARKKKKTEIVDTDEPKHIGGIIDEYIPF